MSGQWSGGPANRYWQRPGHRVSGPGDTGRSARLFALLAPEPFWCDNCGSMHPLIEHRECRAAYPGRSAYRGAA